MDNEIILVINGNIPSKSNKYRRGRGKSFYIDPVVKAFSNSALKQILVQMSNIKQNYKLPLECQLNVEYIFEAKRKKDADNMEKTINDILQTAGIIKNDNQIIRHTTIINKSIKDKSIIKLKELK